MAAGLGFKDFVTGEVLTAADVDGYLMQGVWVFASAAARDAAVTSPQEGNFAYLKDTNVTTYYTGSAWANLDTTGMTNPMTTTGDTIYSSSGSTPARLGIGTAGQVLQVNSGATAPEWATPASGGGMTLINSGGTTLTGASVTISSIPSTYKNLQLVIENYKPATDGTALRVRVNGDSNANRHYFAATNSTSNQGDTVTFDQTSWLGSYTQDNGTAQGLSIIDIYDYANAVTWKLAFITSISNDATTTTSLRYYNAVLSYNQTTAISSLDLFPASGNFTSGTAYLYGVK
jgi:hypothetical protein